MKKRLVALRAMRYGTRRMQAGEDFIASAPHARVLVKTKHAKYMFPEKRGPAAIPPIPPALRKRVEAGEFESMATLRAEYTAKMGKRPFNGWSAEELRRRMSVA